MLIKREKGKLVQETNRRTNEKKKNMRNEGKERKKNIDKKLCDSRCTEI